MKFDNPKFGIVVEVGADGQVLRSLQDSKGDTYTSVSEVQEDTVGLYIASPGKKFIGYLRLDSLSTPPADQSSESDVFEFCFIAVVLVVVVWAVVVVFWCC